MDKEIYCYEGEEEANSQGSYTFGGPAWTIEYRCSLCGMSDFRSLWPYRDAFGEPIAREHCKARVMDIIKLFLPVDPVAQLVFQYTTFAKAYYREEHDQYG